MKLLLIGPYPPPHGGISVHVMEARQALQQTGAEVRVLNAQPLKAHRGASRSADCLRYESIFSLVTLLLSHAMRGWVFHVHTNGHNRRSWLLALLCGLAGKAGPGSLLTLHSGMTPSYLRDGRVRRILARITCALYGRVVGVNSEIQNSLRVIGVPSGKLEVLPAYLGATPSSVLPEAVEVFLRQHWPVFSTVLFYRPEYGFDFLLNGFAELRTRHPKAGCLVMGSGEGKIAAQLAVLKAECGDAVLLLGDVPHALCLTLMARSQVFLRCTSADGDAISVREALCAGTPVVASDVGHRPPGTLLFPVGDVPAFASRVAQALEERGERHSPPQETLRGSSRLMELYRLVCAGEVRG
jgi:glycosyltransferase involved in cell wall biosynthesis